MEHFYGAASKKLTILWYCQPLQWRIRNVIVKLQYTHHKGATHTNMPVPELMPSQCHEPWGSPAPPWCLAVGEEGKTCLCSSPACPQHPPVEKGSAIPRGTQGGDGACRPCRGLEAWSQQNQGTTQTSSAADSSDLLRAPALTNQHYSRFNANSNIFFWARWQWSLA